MVPAELDDWGQVYAGALPHAPGFSALGTSGKGEGTGPKPGPPTVCGAVGRSGWFPPEPYPPNRLSHRSPSRSLCQQTRRNGNHAVPRLPSGFNQQQRGRNGVGFKRILRRALCLQGVVIEDDWMPDEDTLILRVKPEWSQRGRCSRCQRKGKFYDRLTPNRRWRSMDLGALRVFLEADTCRVRCPDHGVVVAHVPWARPASKLTLAMEDLACWLATEGSQSAVAEFLRITWRSVGAAIKRRVGQTDWPVHTLDLKRIGIDEISYRKGHKYLTVVVDHDSGRLIWAAPGRRKETVDQFFDLLGKERCARITLVTRDAATWISTVVADRCPNAVQCMDPFHVVQWATKAVDEVRRETWRALQYWSHPEAAKFIKGAIWILRRNRSDLSNDQLKSLAAIQKDNKHLYRAYLLKEQLRLIFQLPTDEALRLLDRWLVWARRSQIPQFVDLASTVTD